MRKKAPRILKWLGIILGGSILFQFPITGNTGIGGGGCSRFMTNSVANSIDFCYLLDCDNGFFGGAIQPCGDGSSGGAFLLDCEETTATTTDTTTQTTTGG